MHPEEDSTRPWPPPLHLLHDRACCWRQMALLVHPYDLKKKSPVSNSLSLSLSLSLTHTHTHTQQTHTKSGQRVARQGAPTHQRGGGEVVVEEEAWWRRSKAGHGHAHSLCHPSRRRAAWYRRAIFCRTAWHPQHIVRLGSAVWGFNQKGLG